MLKYIDAHKDVRLANHLPENVGRYLNAKGRLTVMKEWQFRQIADALRLLFCELIQPQWASEYDWIKWRVFARDLEPCPSLMRDANAADIVASSSNPMICKFRDDYTQIHLAFIKTIRIRQMAVRTEKTYEQWICRFKCDSILLSCTGLLRYYVIYGPLLISTRISAKARWFSSPEKWWGTQTVSTIALNVSLGRITCVVFRSSGR